MVDSVFGCMAGVFELFLAVYLGYWMHSVVIGMLHKIKGLESL